LRAAGVDAVLSAVNAAKQLPSAISPAYTKMLLHDAYKCNVMILLTSACFPAVFACAFKKLPGGSPGRYAGRRSSRPIAF